MSVDVNSDLQKSIPMIKIVIIINEQNGVLVMYMIIWSFTVLLYTDAHWGMFTFKVIVRIVCMNWCDSVYDLCERTYGLDLLGGELCNGYSETGCCLGNSNLSWCSEWPFRASEDQTALLKGSPFGFWLHWSLRTRS